MNVDLCLNMKSNCNLSDADAAATERYKSHFFVYFSCFLFYPFHKSSLLPRGMKWLDHCLAGVAKKGVFVCSLLLILQVCRGGSSQTSVQFIVS